MAYKLRMLPSARKEIDEIVHYLSGHGPQTAKNFTAKLRSQTKLISSGTIDYGLSKLPELADLGYRSCPVNSYVMLYYFEGDRMVVAHVFHQSQDYGRYV